MPDYDFSEPLQRRKSWKWENEGVIDGHRVLPMSVADTDFVSPREVTAALQAIVDGREFGYCSYPPDQREVFAEWQRRQHGWEIDPEQVIVANGMLGSLVLMLDAVSTPGDGVIIFPPVYQNFAATVAGTGRIPVGCDLVQQVGGSWQADLDAYRGLCARPDTRAVLLCNPHNPVGKAWTGEELREVVRIAQEHELIVFSDEIHADFVYDQPFEPTIAAAENKLGIMTLTSGGKTFNLGGLFTSYAVTADDRLKKMLLDALQRLHWDPNLFGAWGSWAAYRHGYRYRDELVAYVRRMQVKLVDALNAMPYPVEAALPEATFLLWVDFRASGWCQDQIQRFLVEDAGIGANRGDAYGAGGTGFVRINSATAESRIDEAIARLERAFAKHFG